MDGAFDMMHFGHMNAFRQARELGSRLVVGVNSSESIAECKGRHPVMSDEERCEMVRGCKFVDVVIPLVPYVMDESFIAKMVEEHKVDLFVHGDDACVVDGVDVYAAAKRLGKFATIPRTQGISTTDLVERVRAQGSLHRDFLTTGRILSAFTRGSRDPAADDVVVYVSGDFDLLHVGHLALFEEARRYGTYLLVGIYSDDVVSRRRRDRSPVTTAQERILSVLGCRAVDDVLLDAPTHTDDNILNTFNIKTVVVPPTDRDSCSSMQSCSKPEIVIRLDASRIPLTVLDIYKRIHSS